MQQPRGYSAASIGLRIHSGANPFCYEVEEGSERVHMAVLMHNQLKAKMEPEPQVPVYFFS